MNVSNEPPVYDYTWTCVVQKNLQTLADLREGDALQKMHRVKLSPENFAEVAIERGLDAQPFRVVRGGILSASGSTDHEINLFLQELNNKVSICFQQKNAEEKKELFSKLYPTLFCARKRIIQHFQNDACEWAPRFPAASTLCESIEACMKVAVTYESTATLSDSYFEDLTNLDYDYAKLKVEQLQLLQQQAIDGRVSFLAWLAAKVTAVTCKVVLYLPFAIVTVIKVIVWDFWHEKTFSPLDWLSDRCAEFWNSYRWDTTREERIERYSKAIEEAQYRMSPLVVRCDDSENSAIRKHCETLLAHCEPGLTFILLHEDANYPKSPKMLHVEAGKHNVGKIIYEPPLTDYFELEEKKKAHLFAVCKNCSYRLEGYKNEDKQVELSEKNATSTLLYLLGSENSISWAYLEITVQPT